MHDMVGGLRADLLGMFSLVVHAILAQVTSEWQRPRLDHQGLLPFCSMWWWRRCLCGLVVCLRHWDECLPDFVRCLGVHLRATFPVEPVVLSLGRSCQCAGLCSAASLDHSRFPFQPADHLCRWGVCRPQFSCPQQGVPIGIGLANCQAGCGASGCGPAPPGDDHQDHCQYIQWGVAKCRLATIGRSNRLSEFDKAGACPVWQIHPEPYSKHRLYSGTRNWASTMAGARAGRTCEVSWRGPIRQLRNTHPLPGESHADVENSRQDQAARWDHFEHRRRWPPVVQSVAKLLQDVSSQCVHDFARNCISSRIGGVLRKGKRNSSGVPELLAHCHGSREQHETSAVRKDTGPVGPRPQQRCPSERFQVQSRYGLGCSLPGCCGGPCLLGQSSKETGPGLSFQWESTGKLNSPENGGANQQRKGAEIGGKRRSSRISKGDVGEEIRKGEDANLRRRTNGEKEDRESKGMERQSWRPASKEAEGRGKGANRRKVFKQRSPKKVGWLVSFESGGQRALLRVGKGACKDGREHRCQICLGSHQNRDCKREICRAKGKGEKWWPTGWIGQSEVISPVPSGSMPTWTW